MQTATKTNVNQQHLQSVDYYPEVLFDPKIHAASTRAFDRLPLPGKTTTPSSHAFYIFTCIVTSSEVPRPSGQTNYISTICVCKQQQKQTSISSICNQLTTTQKCYLIPKSMLPLPEHLTDFLFPVRQPHPLLMHFIYLHV